ncbi:MAG: hypothetical protein PHQ04_08810 [Opitutaceae bacterium]|nr:hypothetical protein [Opitutaceae bacterium]
MTVTGLLGSARALAATQQTTARLLVYAQPPPHGEKAKYLRYIQIVRLEDEGDDDWTGVGPPVMLPAGVCIVPPDMGPHLLSVGVSWTRNGSPALLSRMAQVSAQMVDGRSSGPVFYVEFTPDGRPNSENSSTSSPQIVVAPAITGASGLPAFDNPAATRGVLVRRTGSFANIGDLSGF